MQGSPAPVGVDAASPLGQVTHTGVARGAMWSVLGRAVPQAQLLLLSIVAARYLGPAGTGRLSFIAFVSLSLVLMATAGPPASLSRFVGELLGAREADVVPGLYRWTWNLELAAGGLATSGLAALAVFGADPRAAWALAGVGCGLAILHTVPSGLLLGAQHWREAAIPGLVSGVVSVPAVIVALALGGGISGFFAVEAALVLVNLVWTASYARRLAAKLPPPAPVPAPIRSRFLTFAASSTGIVLIQFVVWRRSELFVLDLASSDSQIALYSIAFAAVTGLAQVPEAVALVTMPVAATLVGAGRRDRLRSGFWRVFRLLAFAVPPVVATTLVLGPALLRLVYGEAFAGAGDVLLILLGSLVLIPFLTTSQAVLFALGRLRFLIVVGIAASVVDVGLALLLIPALDAVGAAISNTVAQAAAGLPGLALVWRLLGPADLPWRPALRGVGLAVLTAAAAAAALAALGDGAGGVALALLAGVVVFATVGPLLRPLAADDAEWFVGAFSLERRPRLAASLSRFAPRLQ